MNKLALVFSGASTKIGLHVGACKAISENGIMPTSYYGCSSGSLIAAYLATETSYAELEKLYFDTDFSLFIKHTWVEALFGIFFSAGLLSGKPLSKFLFKLFGSKTFMDVHRDLNIIGHSLSRRSWVLLNKKTHPEMLIASAIRISMSIPLLFKPYKMAQECTEASCDWLVDGGVSKNFPVDLIPADSRFIGHLVQAPSDEGWKCKSMKEMFVVIFDQLLQANVEDSIRNAADGNLVVRSTYEKSIVDFKVSPQEKQKMLEIGYENMRRGLTHWDKTLNRRRSVR